MTRPSAIPRRRPVRRQLLGRRACRFANSDPQSTTDQWRNPWSERTTLREIRQHIERLASDDGAYYVVCARSGERPVPVAGQRFATRPDAADAAQATEQYRAALRRYDPRPRFTIRSSVRLERRTRTRVPPRTVIGGNRTDESRTRGTVAERSSKARPGRFPADQLLPRRLRCRLRGPFGPRPRRRRARDHGDVSARGRSDDRPGHALSGVARDDGVGARVSLRCGRTNAGTAGGSGEPLAGRLGRRSGRDEPRVSGLAVADPGVRRYARLKRRDRRRLDRLPCGDTPSSAASGGFRRCRSGSISCVGRQHRPPNSA